MNPRKTGSRVVTALAVTLVGMVLLYRSVFAHEGREVGPYTLTVGWRVEPALINQMNGLDLQVMMHNDEEEAEEDAEHEETEGAHAEGQPVAGLEEVLQGEVVYGDQRMPLELRAVFGEPGLYTADVLPTQPGSYIFHITGVISGTEIDEEFNAADGQIATVDPLTTVQFPQTEDATVSMQTLQADISQTRWFSLAGLAMGVVALLVGGVAALRR